MATDDLQRAVETVVRRCLEVREGESVLVVADATTAGLGAALRDEAQAAGADAVLTLMAERPGHGVEPPPPVAAALAGCDAFLAPTAKSLSHTQARKRATDGGVRGATLPGVTPELLARVMAVDLCGLGRRSRAVAALLDEGDEARVTCPRGTDFTADLSGRRAIADDGDLSRPGAFGNLPCGEGFVAPRAGEGRLIATSLAAIGLVRGPVALVVDDGRLASAEGDEGRQLLALLDEAGDGGRNLAELGVGTNERATLTGNVLEDEKVLGTAHVAFGASAAIGGTVSVPVHLDVVIVDATVEVDGTTILDRGRYVL